MKNKKHGKVVGKIKSRLLKGNPPKIQYTLTKHAQKKLKLRFGKDNIGKIYENQIENLENLTSNKIIYYLKDRNMVIIRNKNSNNIVTVWTPKIWNDYEFKREWKQSIKGN